MEFSEIWDTVLLVVAVLMTVSWGVVITRFKKLWNKLHELRDEYAEAIADGTITDKEKTEMADTLIEIIDHATTIWQEIFNLIKKIFRKR